MNKLVASTAALMALLLVAVAGVSAANDLTDDNAGLEAQAGDNENFDGEAREGEQRCGPRGHGDKQGSGEGPAEGERPEGAMENMAAFGQAVGQRLGFGPEGEGDGEGEDREGKERKGRPCHKGPKDKRGGEGEDREHPPVERVNLTDLDPEVVEALETLKAFMDELKEERDNATDDGDDTNDTDELKPPRPKGHGGMLIMDLLRQLEEAAEETDDEEVIEEA